MDVIIDFIKSTKVLLTETLELCNALETHMESDNMNIEKLEENLNETKIKFTQIGSVIPDIEDLPVKLKSSKNRKSLEAHSDKLNKPITDIATSMRVILTDIADKIVESHNVVEILDDSLDEKDVDESSISPVIDDSNIFSILSQKETLCDKTKLPDVRILLSDISSECNRISDSSIDKKPNESFESEKELVVDELYFQSIEAKEAILKDSDTESIIECESIKDSNSLSKECSVVLYDICKLDPTLKTGEIQDINKLEREINRLCQIPKTTKPKSTTKRNEKSVKSNSLKSKKKISSASQSESDVSSEFSEAESKHSNIDLTSNYMAEASLSSTDTDGSHESKDDSVIISNGKTKSKSNKTNKRVTRLNLKIPKLASSDSGNDLSSSNSTKKASKKSKRKSTYCSSTASESESDASLSDLYKKVTSKKKSLKKSKTGKSKTSKKEKSSKAEPKTKSNNEEEDDDEIETRKNIHKIMTNSKLSKATKNATQLETDRRKRIEERQKEYNKEIPDDDVIMTSSNLYLALERDKDDNSLVEVDKSIVDNLKPHQIEAVKFLWDCVIESIECLEKTKQLESDEDKNASAVGGCVLAHCMGLGKTLSLIAFMHTMLTTPCLDFQTCLVVCPVNTALNWKREWEMWMPKDKLVNIFEVCSTECKKYKIQVVQDWYNKGGVLIIGYEMYRLLATGDSRTVRRKIVKQKLNEALIEPGPDFVVCDEGHLLKNNKSAINKVITKIHTRRRIVLTGTPLQNRLLEYHTMVQFVKPNLLGTQKEFLNRFVNPINNGQHSNSTLYDVDLMKKRSHILFKTLDGCVHRRDYSALVKYLPPKYEYVIKIRLSDIQVKLYRQYISICKENKHSLFQDHLTFSRIWTHPFVICMHQEIMDKKMFFVDTDEDEDDSFINDGSDSDSKGTDDKGPIKTSNGKGVVNLISDDSDADGPLRKKAKFEKREKSNSDSDSSAEEVVRNWSTTSRSAKKNELIDSDEEPIIDGIKELKDMTPIDKHWWSNIIKPEHEHQIEISGKLSVLFQILRKASDIGDKIIIFSQSLLVLDIIEKYLQELHTIAEKVQEDLKKLNESIEQSPKTAEEDANKNAFFSDIGFNSWIRGLDYDRMDGSTQAFVRADIQSRFNSSDDQRLRLFLISTRAGGMGVNLVAANRVVIFDVSWNPSHDIQAIFRSYRFGQNKPVYVYRLVSQGTMEEKIYERQVTKQSLSLRVIDEQQISRYFTEEDLRSLYKFEPDIYDPEKVRETPILPKDRFLAELIQELPQFIHGYHEHDSLLQNKTEEELTESERRDAWKEFEEEKIHGTRSYPMNQYLPKPAMNQDRMNQLQIMMLQQYPQYAALYAQNYNNLVKYVLSRKPDLNQIQLNNEVQHVFLQSLQKYYNNQAMMANQSSDTVAGSSQNMQ